MVLTKTSLKLLSPKAWSIFSKNATIPKSISDFEVQYTNPICVKVPPIPLALYGGRHTVTMIPGSGIGPELMAFVRKIFTVIGAPVHFEVVNIDADRNDNTELDYALMTIKRNGVAIKGNVETRSKDHSVKLRNVSIRAELDLFVYVMHCKSYPGVRARHQNIDIVVIRQNTEGEYSMLEHGIRQGKVVENLKIITRYNSKRIAKYAFEFAKKNNRKKVTIVHKANIMKLSDGLFLQVAKEIAKEYPDIQYNDMIIDNCCMQLVTKPQQFDVMLAPNLYGNIVANTICGLSGGPGLYSGKNYGEHYAVFESGTRNPGLKLANKNIANPIAMLSASVDMLNHLGHLKHAKLIQDGIFKTLTEIKVHTPDIGGTASSSDVVTKILDCITNK